MKKHEKIFGTDGVRGVANIHPMTSEMALKLGRAIAHAFKNGPKKHSIVVGKDTRISGYMIETALASGICSMGVDVMLVGPLPTPAIAFITQGMRADAGVVISASHNSYRDNGIKFFDQFGYKLPPKMEEDMEEWISSGTFDSQRPVDDQIGKALRLDDAGGRYIEFLKRTIPKGLTFDGIKIVVDCANGAGYRVTPTVLSELGAHVIAVGVHPDGKNINQNCGSTHPEMMCKLVKEHNAHVGLALDGDADRVIMCDEHGTVIDGDAILALCAKHLADEGKLAKNTVVATVVSNIGMDIAMKEAGIRVVRTQVGDRFVAHEMKQNGFNLGGEQSGHMIFLDHNTTGDGTLAALQVISMLKEQGRALSEMKQIFRPFPQIQQNIRVKCREDLSKFPSIQQSIKESEKQLGESGRVLVRYSGTELLVRVLIEGENLDQIRHMASSITEEITNHLGVE